MLRKGLLLSAILSILHSNWSAGETLDETEEDEYFRSPTSPKRSLRPSCFPPSSKPPPSKLLPRCTCRIDYSPSLDTNLEWRSEAALLLQSSGSSSKEKADELMDGGRLEECIPINKAPLSNEQLNSGKNAEAIEPILAADERRAEAAEDCPSCRQLDCDIIFALIFTLIIGCLLLYVVVFWLRGVFQYEGQGENLELEDADSSLSAGVYPPSSVKGYKMGHSDRALPNNIQCIYTFIAKPGHRVKLEFTRFQLAGTADSCDMEYVDVYSELETPSDSLLSASLSGRYCGTIAPHVKISVGNVMVLVFHSRVGSRVGDRRTEKFALDGYYQYISEEHYIPGVRLSTIGKCAFLIESSKRKQGTILSPTYPGSYPKNFYCAYVLRGEANERIRLYLRDFDIYFAGEHCPYDSLTVYDGLTNRDPILKRVCGLQQRLEMFSFGPNLLLEFNTTDPPKGDPRGFAIEYEFSRRFVDLRQVIGNQKGMMHLRGWFKVVLTLMGNRVVLDDQDLEKVIAEFEVFSLHSTSEPDIKTNTISNSHSAPYSVKNDHPEECVGTFVGIATTANSIKAVLANNEESVYDATLCNRIERGSPKLGPYTSQGPRLVLVFGSVDSRPPDSAERASSPAVPLGFRARIEFKTDFGVPGLPMGDSSKCQFLFQSRRGSFNSPRFPANYPVDSNCTYFIRGKKGDQVLLYFKQFALFEGNSKDECKDFVEVFDVFRDENDVETLLLQVSTFGAHEMRVVFSSDSFGTANGFNAVYEIRRAFKENVPTGVAHDPGHCGHVISAVDGHTSGYFTSPGFPVKYNKDQICDWEIRARPEHKVLLQLLKMDVEGEMTETKTSCGAAVIRVHLDYSNRSSDVHICGTSPRSIAPILSPNTTLRISFLTAPEKVNGLSGFNFTWTEVKLVERDSECIGEENYLCSYTRLCIAANLRCNGEENCGEHDDTDEAHCNIAERASDTRTIMVAATFSGFIFLFILGFFCFLFKAKLEKKHELNKRKRNSAKRATKIMNRSTQRLRQPYRPSKKLQQRPAINRSQTMFEHSSKPSQAPRDRPKIQVEPEMNGTITEQPEGVYEEREAKPKESAFLEEANDVQVFYG